MECCNMKTLTSLLFLAFATISSAQNAPTETAAAPGCGAENTKFDVTTDRSKHPFVKPEPGKAIVYFLHHLCAGWQSFVGFNVAQKSAAAHFTAEAGGVYFFVVNDRADAAGQHGERLYPAGMKLSALDSDEGQLLMSKFGFSTSRVRK